MKKFLVLIILSIFSFPTDLFAEDTDRVENIFEEQSQDQLMVDKSKFVCKVSIICTVNKDGWYTSPMVGGWSTETTATDNYMAEKDVRDYYTEHALEYCGKNATSAKVGKVKCAKTWEELRDF